MTVHLYAACWNEIDRLDAFFAHYDNWVDHYFIFDDGSDDGSLDRLHRHDRVTVRRLEHTHPDSLVLSLRHLYNHAWKTSRGVADWVIVVNVDEFVQHRDIRGYLDHCRSAGCTLLPGIGFEIVPAPEPHQAPPWWGTPNVFSNKLAVFNPNAVVEINYDVGRHSARPSGTTVLPARDELMNLHFKYIDPPSALARMRTQGGRLRALDRQNDWGSQYSWSDEKFAEWIAAVRSRAVCLDEHFHFGKTPIPRPWWRPPAPQR